MPEYKLGAEPTPKNAQDRPLSRRQFVRSTGEGAIKIAEAGLLAVVASHSPIPILRPKEAHAEGFPISPDMANAYNQYGGADAWGLAISGAWTDQLGRTNQAFEKGIFQLSPGKVEFANIYDDLSKAGKDPWLDSVRQTPPPADWSSDAGKSWDAVVINRLAILSPAMRQTVETTPDWINRYGLPISIKDYGPWISARFQRSNLQELKQDLPYGKTGQILVANGGSVAKEAGGIIPDSALNGTSVLSPEQPKTTTVDNVEIRDFNQADWPRIRDLFKKSMKYDRVLNLVDFIPFLNHPNIQKIAGAEIDKIASVLSNVGDPQKGFSYVRFIASYSGEKGPSIFTEYGGGIRVVPGVIYGTFDSNPQKQKVYELIIPLKESRSQQILQMCVEAKVPLYTASMIAEGAGYFAVSIATPKFEGVTDDYKRKLVPSFENSAFNPVY